MWGNYWAEVYALESFSLVVAAVEKNLEYGLQNQFRIHFREFEFIFVLHCGGLQKHTETQQPLNPTIYFP